MNAIRPIFLATSMTKSYGYFCHIRWNGRRVCPSCFYRKLYVLSSGYLKCKRCRYRFKDFTGTFLEKVKISLDELAHILYLFVLGVPAYRSRWYIKPKLATVERIFRLIRLAIYDGLVQYLKNMKLSGEIEIDEALFGGHRKGKRGWGAEGKSLVFGIYQRNGKVITFPVSDRKHDTLIPLIEQHTKKGSLYYTDDNTAYAALNLIGKHQIVAHGREEYVREDTTHINGIEGFWSYAKTWLYHYRGVPKQYLQFYLKEIEFRFNNRDRDLFPVVSKMMVNLVQDL
jgi:transposase